MSEDATLDEFVEAESDSSEPETEDLARKTVCGIPPQDWTVARLGELVRVVSGNSLPTEYQNGKEGDHPVYKVSDMNATGNEKYVSDTSNRLLKEDLEEINHTLYPEGTTILPKVGAALLTNKRRLLTESSSFDNNVMGWVPDEINPEFLYYVSCMIDMEAVAQKGAVPSISKAIAKSLKVPSPPLPEQRKIATVLYTVDRAIEKTEKIIKQKKELRKGLVQKLFSRGYYKYDDFEEYVFGSYPSDWKLVELSELVVKGPQNGIYKQNSEYGSGVSIIELSDLYNNEKEIDYGDFRAVNLSDDEIAKYSLERDDIIVNRVSKQVSGVGKALRVTFEEDAVFESNMIRLRLKNDIIPEYLVYFTRSENYNKYIGAVAKHSNQASINQSAINNLKIPLPSLDEQQEIVRVIDSVSDSIRSESEYNNQLQRLKEGLQQDLLSGTVRTTDTNIEVPDEITQHG